MNKPLKLDKEELKTLRDFERGELESIKSFRDETRKLEEAARLTFQNNKRINIRLSSRDLENIQKKAPEVFDAVLKGHLMINGAKEIIEKLEQKILLKKKVLEILESANEKKKPDDARRYIAKEIRILIDAAEVERLLGNGGGNGRSIPKDAHRDFLKEQRKYDRAKQDIEGVQEWIRTVQEKAPRLLLKAKTLLSKAMKEMESAVPAGACPKCNGKVKSCELCGGLKWVRRKHLDEVKASKPSNGSKKVKVKPKVKSEASDDQMETMQETLTRVARVTQQVHRDKLREEQASHVGRQAS